MSSKKKKFTDIEMGEDHVFVKKELSEEVDSVGDQEKHTKKFKLKKRKDNYENFDVSAKDSEEIKQKLTEIYENGDGTMPDMQTFEKNKRSKVLKAFFVLIFSFLFFAVVAWLGFFVIAPKSDFSQDDVVLTISGDEQILYGQEVTYRIRYRNAQNIALQKANLEVKYPKGFVFTTSSVATATDQHDTWQVGMIDAQGSGYIDVIGKVFGDINEKQSFRVFLNYSPENFSSQFQKVAHVSVGVEESPVDVDVQIPTEVPIGSQTDIAIVVSPHEGQQLSFIDVVCESETFSVKSITGSGAHENNECGWSFDTLIEPQEVHVLGSFPEDSTTGDTKKFIVRVLGWESSDKTGNGHVLAEVQKEITLSKTNTVFNLAVNGGTGSLDVEPGENLNMTVQLKNTGDTVMHNASVRVVIEAPSYTNRSILNWAKIDISSDGDIFGTQLSDTVRQGEIIFDKRYITDLAQVMPGKDVGIDITLPIKNGLETTLPNYTNSAIRIYAELKYDSEDTKEVISSNEVNLTIASDFDIEVSEQISQDAGGNPVHAVTWLVSNSFHELENITLEADIYGDISINKEDIVVPSGNVEYSPESKKMIWKIDSMPTSVDVLAMQFSVVILKDNPSQKNLTSKVTVKAKDKVSGVDIIKVGDEILLNL